MDRVVHPSEQTLFGVCLAISVMIYFLLVISLFGIFYIVFGVIAGIVAQGLFVGAIRGNAVRVSETQLPEVQRIAGQIAAQLGLAATPPIYVMQEGGALNAFATRFLGRDMVIIYSDVLEMAYEEGEAALAFVVAHEMAHVARRHVVWHQVLYPAMIIPFLGAAYSRGCELTCDRYGAECVPAGAIPGLMVLAAGKRLYRRTSAREFAQQNFSEMDTWCWLAEALSSHPNLARRVHLMADYVAVSGMA